jgi:ATP-dependent protease ClpP protease subunit
VEEEYKNNNKMDCAKLMSKISATEWNVYIVGDIVEDYTNYIPLHELLTDERVERINFIIKTLGGDFYSSVTLATMIRQSKARTVAHIFTARSGGSIIALACKFVVLCDDSTLMIHEPQFTYNKNNYSQVKAYVDFIGASWERQLNGYEQFDEDIREKISRQKEVFYSSRELRLLLKDKLLG